MSEITVKWNQRVAGRFPGQTETVEDSPFILACVGQGRCDLIARVYAPVVEISEFDHRAPIALDEVPADLLERLNEAMAVETTQKVARRRKPVSPEPTFEAEVEAVVAAGEPGAE